MYGSADDVPLAALRDAVVRFGTATALKGVTLALQPASVTALLGPNGAGKTSAVRLLLGLIRPQAGTATLFGLDPRDRAARRRTGAMLQIAKVPETLRVAEHIDTFRSYYPAPVARAELLRLAGLVGLERRLYGTLSGGERQRVLLALALAGDPDLLFLDEPTVGMDVAARRAFWRSIRLLRDRGRAVLLTTHYLEEADALADRVVVLNHGSIVADGTPADIRRRVAGRRIRCITSLPLEAVRAIPGVTHAATRDGHTDIVATAAERVAAELLRLDPALRDLEITGAGLEESFLQLTDNHTAAATPAEEAAWR